MNLAKIICVVPEFELRVETGLDDNLISVC